MRKIVFASLMVFAVIQIAPAASLVDFASPGSQSSQSQWSLGFEFQVNSPITLTGLGTFDYGQDGLVQPQQVGLWDSGGNLIASTYVTNADPLEGFWRFNSIAPVALTAGGTYYVASQGGEGYTWATNGFTVAPEITFLQDAWQSVGNAANDPLAFPGSTENLSASVGGAFFGANAEFGTTATPEPASLYLLAGGLLVLAGTRRKRV